MGYIVLVFVFGFIGTLCFLVYDGILKYEQMRNKFQIECVKAGSTMVELNGYSVCFSGKEVKIQSAK